MIIHKKATPYPLASDDFTKNLIKVLILCCKEMGKKSIMQTAT